MSNDKPWLGGVMVERVAAAMRERSKQPLGNIESLEPVLVGSLGDAWFYLARAAIEAIREPTAEMLLADNLTFSENKYAGECTDIWWPMVDEARK
jgi:hypothetical protein